MKRLLFLLLPFLAAPVWAGDYTLTLSGDSSAACTISFSTEAESVDGTHPLQAGDITAFACTITEADPDLVLGLGDLQYPAGLDYRVSGGKVTALDLQTTTGNMLQIGNATPTTIDSRWYLFGAGTVLNAAANRVVIAESAEPVLRVGPSEQYTTLSDAIAASQEGDTILVEAGIYESDYATIRHDLTIKGINGLATLVANEPIPNGKGILVIDANVTIENLKFSDASVPDENGAGIRHETGTLLVRNSIFENNQIGLLGGDDATSSITIVGSEFVNNGNGDWQCCGSGHGHGIYILKGSVVIEDSTFRDTKWGHHIKSRAEQTTVRNSLIDDGVGNVSYSVNLPNGGQGLLEGNTIVQSASVSEPVGNPKMVSYGEEGSLHANNSLLIKGNTFIDHHPNGTGVYNATTVVVTLQGNTFQDVETVAIGPHEIVGDSGPNNPPVAVDDATSVSQGVATPIYVRANDTDDDGDTLSVISVTTPGDGSAAVAGGGTHVTYTSKNPFTGNPDTFDYTVSDGNGGEDTATVTITRVDILTIAQQSAALSAGQWAPLATVNRPWDPGVMVTQTEADAICAAATPQCDLNTADPPEFINATRHPYGDNGEYASSQIFTAWNSAAFNRPENEMYFHGGGHLNYGGTEVIQFDFDTLTWSRVGPQLPLNDFHGSPIDKWHPEDADSDGYPDAPPMPHTYDGWNWFEAAAGGAGRALLLDMVSIYPSSGDHTEHYVNYMFDPDTGTWTHHPTAGYFYSSCVEIVENDEMLCFDDTQSGQNLPAYKIAADGTETYCGLNLPGDAPTYSAVTSFRDPTSGKYYVSHWKGIQELTIDTNDTCNSSLGPINFIPIELFRQFSEGGIGQACPATGVVPNKIFYWNGARWMLTFDTSTETWEMTWNDAGKAQAPFHTVNYLGDDRIYQKCACLLADDACVFIRGVESDPNDTSVPYPYEVPSAGFYLWKAAANPVDVDQVDIGTLTLDGSTQTMLALFLPVDGDKNFNAVVSTRYREVGSGTWITGINLERIHPEYTKISRLGYFNYELPEEGFAGVIWDLQPGTDYEVEVTVSDTDGTVGTTPQTLASVSTKALPISDYSALGETIVTTVGQINSGAITQCDGTGTGHVFTVAAGTTIDATTTPIAFGPIGAGDCGADLANPIVLRGEDQATSVIDCRGLFGYCIRVFGGHAIVENLTILADDIVDAGVEVGGRTGSCDIGNVTVRDMVIGSPSGPVATYGINAGPCALHDVYIADNKAFGHEIFGQSSGGGGTRGITLTGRDMEAAHNELVGFIDGIITSAGPAYADPNIQVKHARVVNIHHNIVSAGVDDGFELDYTFRNTIAHNNLIANTSGGGSFQPIWGGPAFAIHNIFYNTATGWIKAKAELDNPAGMFVYNNTSIKNGTCLYNDAGNSSQLNNFHLVNNLFVCQGTQYQGVWMMLFKNWMTYGSTLADYNVWAGPDGQFQMGDGSVTINHLKIAADAAAWIAAPEWGTNDTHADPLTIFDTLVLDFDDTSGGYLYGDLERVFTGKSFLLDSGSPAKDAGTYLPGITPDGDASPDVGACQFAGQCDTTGTFYGVR